MKALIALALILLTSCTGQWVALDAIPDRIEWGYVWGDSNTSYGTRHPFTSNGEVALFEVRASWDVGPHPLLAQVTAMNMTMRRLLEEQEVAFAARLKAEEEAHTAQLKQQESVTVIVAVVKSIDDEVEEISEKVKTDDQHHEEQSSLSDPSTLPKLIREYPFETILIVSIGTLMSIVGVYVWKNMKGSKGAT